MIRILHIVSDTNIGGAGRVILNYLRSADKERFDVHVAIPMGSLLKRSLEEMKVPFYEVEGIADRSFQKEDVKILGELIDRVKPQLVHTHGAMSGRIAARHRGIPVVYTRHAVFPVPGALKFPPGRWGNRLFNQIYADHVIAVSPATLDNLTREGVSPKKITVVMNGVTPVGRTGEEERSALRRELGIPEDTFLFGILTRIEDYKGHLYLLSAARKLKERGHTNFRILIAGTGDFEEDIEEAVIVSGVSDVVQMLGFRTDVKELLNILDCQLNASYSTEATSVALLEGMSVGLPSVVSDYGGNPWVVEDGVNGLIFPSRDSNALCDKMEYMLTHPQQGQEMGKKAEEIFQSRFTGRAFARRTEEIYLNVLNKPRRGKKEEPAQ